LIETVDSGIDVVSAIDSFRDDLLATGFVDLHVESIGEHVWHGFDAWIAQTEFKDGWGRNWLKAYHRGLIDDDLVANARDRGEQLLAGARKLAVPYPEVVREVRGLGLLVGVELTNEG